MHPVQNPQLRLVCTANSNAIMTTRTTKELSGVEGEGSAVKAEKVGRRNLPESSWRSKEVGGEEGRGRGRWLGGNACTTLRCLNL